MAQAVTLRNSFKRFNGDIDFYIFLADLDSGRNLDVKVVELSESWIPKWREMAFKYDVVEFSTSVKPFAINHLFNLGFSEVIYLDPDTYVTDSLEFIWGELKRKSILLTPHFFKITTPFTGAVGDATILGQGVFNLGFGAFKASPEGVKLVRWWMERLEKQCFVESSEGLFVDQKWMNYAPVFFPDSVEILHHAGVNVAIWNLHERTLELRDDGGYTIRDCDGRKYPLLLFHFSGFDPFDKEVINRRHPEFNVRRFPSFIPIIEQYREEIYANGYNYYRVMKYSFSTFSNGEDIIVMQRRLYRTFIERGGECSNPFDSNGSFYELLRTKRALTKRFTGQIKASPQTKERAGNLEKRLLIPLSKFLFRVLGVRWYFYLVRYAAKFSRVEYHDFLIK